jgi:hypothetical protein
MKLARPRVLDRAEMPVDTAELARFLIGKTLMRIPSEGIRAAASSRPKHIGDPVGHAYRGRLIIGRLQLSLVYYRPVVAHQAI